MNLNSYGTLDVFVKVYSDKIKHHTNFKIHFSNVEDTRRYENGTIEKNSPHMVFLHGELNHHLAIKDFYVFRSEQNEVQYVAHLKHKQDNLFSGPVYLLGTTLEPEFFNAESLNVNRFGRGDKVIGLASAEFVSNRADLEYMF